MPAATRHHDNDTGHDACPPRGLASHSGDVFINGRGAGRVGDTYPPHSGKIAAGSATVSINGRQAGRIGDPVSCGGSVAVGSADVFIGG